MLETFSIKTGKLTNNYGKYGTSSSKCLPCYKNMDVIEMHVTVDGKKFLGANGLDQLMFYEKPTHYTKRSI